MSEVERRKIAMLFPIISSSAVLIIGGVLCGRDDQPDALSLLAITILTGIVSSYLFFHFYIWKDDFSRNLIYVAAVLLLFGLGVLCGRNFTEALRKKNW